MADHENDRPGEPPAIRDEAADSPMWLPVMGLALLLLGAVFLVWRSSTDETADPGVEAAEVEDGEEAEPEEAEAPE